MLYYQNLDLTIDEVQSLCEMLNHTIEHTDAYTEIDFGWITLRVCACCKTITSNQGHSHQEITQLQERINTVLNREST